MKTVKNLLLSLTFVLMSVLCANAQNKVDATIIINIDTVSKNLDSTKRVTYFLYSASQNKLELMGDRDFFNLQKKQVKQQRWEPYKVILLYSASIMFNAVGDGLNDSNHRISGHLWNAASIGTLLLSPAILNYQKDKWYWYAISYVGLRVLIFD